MEDLIIEPTQKTPSVEFYNGGKLVLNGCSYPENAKDFYDPIIEWIIGLEVKEVDFDLGLEYINTASAKKLLDLLKKLDKNSVIEDIKINWFYEEGDEDNLESGQIFEEILTRAKFNYVEYKMASKV